MYGSQYLTEENNTLHIDGVAATDLAAQYGTPLYVMAERELTDRLATVREHFLDKYPNTYASFASKALTVSAVYEQVVRHGLGIDVVTGGNSSSPVNPGFQQNESISMVRINQRLIFSMPLRKESDGLSSITLQRLHNWNRLRHKPVKRFMS